MLIVDAQVHIWGADTLDRPWPPGRGRALVDGWKTQPGMLGMRFTFSES